jgi:hypothetical protein
MRDVTDFRVSADELRMAGAEDSEAAGKTGLMYMVAIVPPTSTVRSLSIIWDSWASDSLSGNTQVVGTVQ